MEVVIDIEKTPEELVKGVDEVISLIHYYQEGIFENIDTLNASSLKSQACILDKIDTLEEVLRVFGINSYEYNNRQVVLKESNKKINTFNKKTKLYFLLGIFYIILLFLIAQLLHQTHLV